MTVSLPEDKVSLGVVEREPGKFRCRCLRCGCHVIAQGGYRPGGQCTNCGSYELGPINQPESTPPDQVTSPGERALRTERGR